MVPGRVPRGTAPTAVPAPAGPAEAAARPLEAAAGAFLDEVGGTSGPLFGLLFQEIAAAVRAGGATSPTAALAAGVRNGLAAIQRVGEAEVGDKTLVDALAPAAAALASSTARDPRQALADAARAAWRGVHDTARMTARRGRASYLGDRAAGVPDPGAVGIGLLFTAASGPVTTLGPLLR
ncbi:DAK2 domain-containing protein [Streptomyces sp. NBC_01198]|uniref:DAK2 domain-containing protein n=1 Tax=Streptomyces sp. NBC_01198 TaxID=2903769 RepID=UPI002E1657E0|nr:DAK2 domain-containing protein [Streptomyces sp. NBC_01198]